MRSTTTKRSVGGLVAFVVGLGASMVLVIGALVVGGGKPAAFVTAVPVAGGSAVAGGGSDKPAPAPDNELNIVEKDFAIAADKTTLKAGSIKFNVTNNGPSPHNIEVMELKKVTATIDPGKSGTLQVDLQPGTYTVICNIPGHEQLGMKIMLTVQ